MVGSTTVTNDSSGRPSFGLTLPASHPVRGGDHRDRDRPDTGDTSEFSAEATNAPLIAFSATQYLRERAGELGRDHA